MLVLAGACGDDGDGGGDVGSTDTAAVTSSSETTETAPETTEPATPEEQVLADYEAALDALSETAAVSDPEHPDLLAHWDGDALAHLQVSIENYVLNGQAAENSIDPNPTGVEFDPENPDVAWVTDCFVDHTQRVDMETREPVGELNETVAATKRRLERVDGTWKIVKDEYLEVDGCTPPED